MFLNLPSLTVRSINLPFFLSSVRLPNCSFRLKKFSRSAFVHMGQEVLNPFIRRRAQFRLCNVSGYTNELPEIHADDPSLHVLFIPGNPGIVSFYKDFVESLYQLLGGRVSITAIGHLSQTTKDWEGGRLFSLQEQIDHKIEFVRQELQNKDIPLLLVGHSIGSYISIELYRKFQDQVVYCIGLHPFMMVNRQSRQQFLIGKLAGSRLLSTLVSSFVALLGVLPSRVSSFVVSKTIGKSWSRTASEAACTYLLKYHVMRNILFMALSEFEKLSETPDWAFMKKSSRKLSFLFCMDDHWAPMHVFEEIWKQIPEMDVSVEREGHTHAFCCSEAGSLYIAQHVASLIKNHISD
ncbi:lipid droplet-associated hydrolase isoform X1 [Cucurbita moschata]|uniref:Lipid droplet-associated hydrolase isoform X1 n=2 Tax=Cucurbita moschata TaxID=3662 RepID=A0A6J1HG44_CUCMO|nr:lipid droplet-associated hydrolase isoform X1 [Cucurbita moschata]XP_022963430.1 lipid droplet-associated hydrolase isoform X1 [Cucurbita moschata]XP_022963431.1 lipid droplet-associated hydrolase isoform X1 [Cucurbita moschata]